MAEKHIFKATFEDIGSLFEEAADTGGFSFDDVPYEDFIEFLKLHSPDIKIQFGKRDPAFVAELKRLSELAYGMSK
jgi:hypothetical protein